MKIIGGSFGADGRARVDRQGVLRIHGATTGVYRQAKAATADVRRDRRFSVMSFLLGLLVFGAILGVMWGAVGVVVALVIAIIGSFYGDKHRVVTLVFDDRKTITVECVSRRQVNRLCQMGAK